VDEYKKAFTGDEFLKEIATIPIHYYDMIGVDFS
jgi:hypothetical protein